MKQSIVALTLSLMTLASAGPLAKFGRSGAGNPSVENQNNVPSNASVLPPIIENGGPFMTVTVTNMQAAPVSTAHTRPTNSPAPVQGSLPPGIIPAGGRSSFVVPSGYKGNIAVGNAKNTLNLTCASLIELSNLPDPKTGVVTADIDISYVDGFTNSITCSCGGRVVTGCNKNLYQQGNKCTTKHDQCCANLKREVDNGPAGPFFAPCAGKAFTYPNDFDANSFGECQGLPITCCIGQNCPENV